MRYYLLSVWKRNGERSYSQCCSTSTNFDDLLYNMTLYSIEDDEMYVICMCENGNELNQKGVVFCDWYYNKEREQIEVAHCYARKNIINSINKVLEEQ